MTSAPPCTYEAEEPDWVEQHSDCNATVKVDPWRGATKCVGCNPRAKDERDECRFLG